MQMSSGKVYLGEEGPGTHPSGFWTTKPCLTGISMLPWPCGACPWLDCSTCSGALASAQLTGHETI